MKYGAILIDPPWQYNMVAGKTAKRWGTADAHYNLMTPADLEAMPVRDLAAPDCALFMWATMPVLPQAIELGAAWGFKYKTCAFTWVKNNRGGFGFYMGLGMWTRANAELCLLFTRGAPKRKAADVRQVIMAPVRRHSQKPDEQYDRIMRLVDGPYVEVFARRPWPGWDAIGNEIDGRDVRDVLREVVNG
jgi:N6-adenosine-specific RNA methylase IME4